MFSCHAPPDQLRKVFAAFASFGCHEPQTELDGSKLMKLVKDCSLLSSRLTTVDVDLIFLKTKGSREKRHIDFDQFIIVLSAFAALKVPPFSNSHNDRVRSLSPSLVLHH